jgi:hypothetical protein
VSRQAGTRKASESEPLTKRRKTTDDIKTGVCAFLRDEPGGCPLTGQAMSGVKAARAWSAASAWNVGKRALMLRPGSSEGVRVARGSASSGRNREALSTDAVRAGGPARSSGEALVMSVKRRGRLICGLFARATGRGPGGDE